MTVRVVTDSTADIPADVAAALDIAVVPLHIHFGEETYEDGVTITSEEFYRRLTAEPHLPKTSAPASGTFTEVYERLAREADEIVSIHISSKLSATYSSALLGREALTSPCRIEVIDSYSASIGLGLLAIRAARLAREGASLDVIVRDITAAIPRTHYFGVVDTLEYLHKGGRIGHPIERVRGRQKAFDRLCEMVAGYSGISSLAIAHTTAEEEMELLGARLAQFFPADRILKSRCGATLGTYLGPNTLCVALIQEDAGNGPAPRRQRRR